MKKIVVVLAFSLLLSFCSLFHVNAYEGTEALSIDLYESDPNLFDEESPKSIINSLDNITAEREVSNEDGNHAILVSQTSSNFVTSNSKIVNEYVYETDFAYDTVTVTYFSTDGVELHSYSNKDASLTNKSVSVSWTPKNSFIDDEKKNVYDFQEDRVITAVSFWKDGEIYHTESNDIFVLYTPYGTFISDIDPILCRRNYCRYLLSYDLIDEATYEDLDVMFHRCSANPSEVPQIIMAEFDQTVSENEKSKLSALFTAEYSQNVDGIAGAVSADAEGEEDDEDDENAKTDFARVLYHIYPIDNNQLQVWGYVYWYVNNDVRFPAQYVKVEIKDEDVVIDDKVATVITNANGFFSATFDNQPDESGRDIYLKVYCGNDDTMVYDFGIFDFSVPKSIDECMPSPYYFTSNTTMDILSDGVEREAESPVGQVVSHAFSIGNALYYGREYEKYINGGEPLDGLVTRAFYPLPLFPQSFALPVHETGGIFLTEDIYADWSTILHEYGHSVEDKLNIFVGYEAIFSEGWFTHDSRYNLTDLYQGDKEKALNISWNEGWAYYYSMVL